MQLRVVLSEEPDGRWSVWCPELPGCASYGDSRNEAISKIREAITLYLEPSELPDTPNSELLEIAV